MFSVQEFNEINFTGNVWDMIGAGAGFAALGVTVLLIALAIYIYTAWALMVIAHKTRTENAWLAWIPIANLYLMTQISQTPWWTFLIVLFAGLIPVVGWIISLGITAWWWWLIAERRRMPGWLGILMIIPLVNLVVIGYIAWAK